MSEESRPLSAQERTWVDLYGGAPLRCEEEGCENEATHSKSRRIAPGAYREWFVCEQCATREES